eukprot:c34799_g1_i1 orf=3-206(+)
MMEATDSNLKRHHASLLNAGMHEFRIEGNDLEKYPEHDWVSCESQKKPSLHQGKSQSDEAPFTFPEF